jgi:phage-related protein
MPRADRRSSKTTTADGWLNFTHVEHRVMYVAKFEEAVYVLHAFEKRSRQTRGTDLTLARERLKQVEGLRREERRRR